MVSGLLNQASHNSEATRAATLDISDAFYRVWYAGLIQKRKS